MEKYFDLEVYVLLNIETNEYLVETGDTFPSLYSAMWWRWEDDASNYREIIDNSNEFSIKKMKITYEII